MILAEPPVAPHPRFDHRALFHQGPGDLAERVASELAGALAQGEPVHLSVTAPEWEALRDHIGPALDQATRLDAGDRYANPGTAMAELHEFVRRSVESGAETVWSVGAVQIEGDPQRDARWVRYETAVDTVLAHTPLRGICVYDTTRSPDQVLDTVRSCHTTLDEPGLGRHPCAHHRPYDHARVRWRHRTTAPSIDTVVTEAGVVRDHLRDLLAGSLPTERLNDLRLVATELVTNGMRHGADPVLLRAWDLADEVVLEVIDHGPGIADRFADLRPPSGGVDGGFGMWLVGQFADQVSIGHDDDRTVVVASMRRPAR
jgi:anti-sigma regulatory factor (Ser/Thr protein kinase)